jgi:hypothetical protein
MSPSSKPETTSKKPELLFKFDQQASYLANRISTAMLKPVVKIGRFYNRSLPEHIHEV